MFANAKLSPLHMRVAAFTFLVHLPMDIMGSDGGNTVYVDLAGGWGAASVWPRTSHGR